MFGELLGEKTFCQVDTSLKRSSPMKISSPSFPECFIPNSSNLVFDENQNPWSQKERIKFTGNMTMDPVNSKFSNPFKLPIVYEEDGSKGSYEENEKKLMISSSSSKSCKDSIHWSYKKDLWKSQKEVVEDIDFVSKCEDAPLRLHISNIPFRYREFHLNLLFNAYGRVLDTEVIYNDKGSKGYGFVTMASVVEAFNAKKALHECMIEGRIVYVNMATPKQRERLVVASSLNRQSFRPSRSEIRMLNIQTKIAETQLFILQMHQKSMQRLYYRGEPKF